MCGIVHGHEPLRFFATGIIHHLLVIGKLTLASLADIGAKHSYKEINSSFNFK